MSYLSLFADHATYAIEFLGRLIAEVDDFVQSVGDFACLTRPFPG